MSRPHTANDDKRRGGNHGDPAPFQRIDRFLWYTRLSATRSAAQTLAERAIIRLNGRRVERAHTPVRRGDLLTLPIGNVVRAIRIVQLPARRGPAPEARTHYEILETGDTFASPPPSPIDIDAGTDGE